MHIRMNDTQDLKGIMNELNKKTSGLAEQKTDNCDAMTGADHEVCELKLIDGKFHLVPVPDELQGVPYLQDIYIAQHLINQIVGAITYEDEVKANGAMYMYRDIAPEGGVESLLAAQMVSTHNLAMEFSKRAMLSEQPPDAVNSNVNRVVKLMRIFIEQTDALNKLRNKGKQTIQVQHVHVNEGGQAVVGNVQGGGGNG